MALSMTFPIDEALMKVYKDMKDNKKISSCIAVIQSERIVLHKEPLPSSGDLHDDMAEICKVITADELAACFIVIRFDDTYFAHIVYASNAVKTRERVMYASSSLHLRDKCGLRVGADNYVTDIVDIKPSLFSKMEDLRIELMTDKEKAEEEISKMEPAPAPVAMAGVACPLSGKAVEAVKEFDKGDIIAGVFAVGKDVIDLENTFPKGTEMEIIVKEVIQSQPRFILISYESKSWLVYLCPPAAKPKDKMPYASSKSSFIKQITDIAPTIGKLSRVEIDNLNEMVETMKDHLKEFLPVEVAPVAPKQSLMFKGPRMLI